MGYLGLQIFNRTRQNQTSTTGIIKATTAFILGQGFMSSLWLILTLRAQFLPEMILGIIFICAVLGIILGRQDLIRSLRQSLSLAGEFGKETLGWKILIGLTLIIILAWITSLARTLNFDGVSFYMALPKVIAYSHQLIKMPGYEDFTAIGLSGELHYAALMAMNSADAAQLFIWPTMLAASIMLVALGQETGIGKHGQWLLVAMVYTSSSVVLLSGAGKVDLFAAAFGFAAYYWIIQARHTTEGRIYWLTGLFSGFAFVAKLSFIPIMIIGIGLLFVWFFIDRYKEVAPRNKKQIFLSAIKSGCLIICGIFLATLPHFIKNSLFFNNPFAPLGVGTTGWLNQSWYSEQETNHILLTYPLQLFFGNNWSQFGTLSPLILAFLPLLSYYPRIWSVDNKLLLAITLAALVSTFVWVLLRPGVFAPRYIIVSLLLFAIPAARGAEFILQNEKMPRLITTGVLCLSCIVLISTGLKYNRKVFYPKKTYLYLSGQIPECARYSKPCEVTSVVNKEAAIGTRVFAPDYLRYYLRADMIQCLPSSFEIFAFLNLDTPEQRLGFIYRRGFSYLMIYAHDDETLATLDIDNPPDWLSITKMVDSDYLLLKFESKDPDQKQGTTCRQVKPFVWEPYTW